jgi:hypothetical protein
MSTEKWGDSVDNDMAADIEIECSSEPKDQVVVDWLGDL